MAAAYRQSKSVGTAGASTTVVSPALTSAVLAGSRLVAYIVWGATTGSIGTVSDSVNGTTGWVKVVGSGASESGGPTQGEVWTNPNSAAGSSLVVTATFAAGASFGFTAIDVHEVTGTDPTEGAGALASARSQASVTNFTTPNITPTVAGCYIFGACSNDVDSVVPTANSPYTLRETTANQVTATEDQVQGAAAAVGASFTFAAAKSGVVSVVAFKPAGGNTAPLLPTAVRFGSSGLSGIMGMVMRANALMTTNQAIVAPSGAVVLAADVGALTLTGFAPSLAMALAAQTGSLTVTGFAPSLAFKLNAGTGALTLSGIASSLRAGLNPGTGALILTGFAGTAVVAVAMNPGTGVLTLTGFAPTLVTTNNVVLAAQTGQLTLTGLSGTVVATGTVPTVTTVTSHQMRFRPRRHWF